jgi:hypothetical protein
MVTSIVESKKLSKQLSKNSVVNFILGSNAKLPPGELSNIKPKSEKMQ